MKSEDNAKGRRRVLKMIAGAGILIVAGVIVSTLRIFTGGPETTPNTTRTTSQAAATTARTGTAATTSVATSSAAGSAAASKTVTASWPRLKAVNVSSLQPSKALMFDYPLVGLSNVLVKLGVKADNGVGPDGDIVAFNRICQHQGCLISFLSSDQTKEGYCACHGSQYDFLHNGSIVTGPTEYPVPRVLLEYDAATGDIYVVGMGPPVIFEQGPLGATNPADLLKYDLQGGQIVTEITVSPLR